MNDISEFLSPRVIAEDFLAEYCRLLDDFRLEEWAALFAPEGSYQIRSGENERQNLPAAILLLETRNAIQDRVSALRKTAVYNIHHSRRIYSGLQSIRLGDNAIEFSANLCVYQTDQDGHSKLFCVGQYQGVLALGETHKIVRFTVLLDTFAIPTLLAVPL